MPGMHPATGTWRAAPVTARSRRWTRASTWEICGAWCSMCGRVLPTRFDLGQRDIPRLMERCRGCHSQEFAEWRSGAHSATYQRLFLDAGHNGKRLLMDDCLRCHGMHFEGGIRDLVAPVDTKGPWRLLRPELAGQPAIPCLSCHQIHRQGELLPRAAHQTGNPFPPRPRSRSCRARQSACSTAGNSSTFRWTYCHYPRCATATAH